MAPRTLPLAVVLAVTGLALLQARPAPAHGQVIRTIGRVLVTAGVDGHFADPVCTGAETLAPADFARHGPTLASAASQSDHPLILDAGSLLSPFGVARWAAAADPEGLAALVADLGYRAIALGALDLAAPRGDLVDVLRALRDRGVPTLATNLRCDDPEDPLCEVLVDGSDGVQLLRFSQGRAAVVSLLVPDVARTLVPPERLAGLRLVDPATALRAAVRRARATVPVVVATLDLRGAGDATTAALALVRELDVEDRPDLLVVSGAGGQLSFARPADFRPALVAPPAAGVLEVRVRENLLSDSFDVLAVPQEPREAPSVAILDWVDRVGARYCAELGQVLPGGRLERPLDAAGLARLAAGAVRDALGVEIALVPRRVVEPSWSPAHPDRLTASDVYVGLRYDAPLVRATVDAAWLTEALAGDLGARLLARGVERVDGGLRVHGRAPPPGARYQVVTTGFLARSGGLPAADWRPAAGSLRSLTRAWLGRRRDGDPRDGLRRPRDGVEWRSRVGLDATFEGASVDNPEGNYGASLLSGTTNVSFGGDLSIAFDALAPEWSWENRARVQYTLNQSPTARTNPTDLVRYETSLVYRGLRDDGAGPEVPELYVDNLFETELTTPAADDPEAEGARDFYRVYTRPSLGLRFPLADILDLRVGFSTEVDRSEQRTPDVRPGLNTRLALAPWTLIEEGDRRVTLELSFDANVARWFDPEDRTTQLRANAALVFVVVGPFRLALDYDLYAQKDARFDPDEEGTRPAARWGLYARGVVRVGISWAGRTVSW